MTGRGYRQVLQPASSDVQRPPTAQPALQLRFRQSEMPLQVTSQAHDEPQVTPSHEALPVQLTAQAPSPQVMLRQLCVPLQVTLHDVLLVQLTPLLQAPSREHWTSQLKPSGQLTCCLQPPLSAQSIVQIL